MRIALVTHIRSRVGGTEAYIDHVASGLAAAGHDLALWHEVDGDPGRGLISIPAESPVWSVERLGGGPAITALRQWRPDVLYSHGVSTPAVERTLLDVAPAVMFAHAYHGACISGSKSRLSPRRAPCTRPLGVPCLLHYFPRRCGGLNPLTMATRYALETSRRDMLHRYAAIVTASSHMRAEYLRYGLGANRVHVVGLMIPQADAPEGGAARPDDPTSLANAGHDLRHEWRLLFVARLTDLKGGDRLLDALPLLRRSFQGRIVLTIAGDGPERESLEKQARKIELAVPDMQIRFEGWMGRSQLRATLATTDLLIMPSVWPEPYGLAGPEAGLLGVPAAAFAVGGIPEWLTDGVNGHLAPGVRPRASDLADAIVRSLRDPAHHASLRDGARAAARALSIDHHLPRLLPILAAAAERRGPSLTAS